MSESKSTANCGCTTVVLTVLTIFITLKLLGILTWSWFWIISPLFLYLVFPVLLFVMLLGAVVIPRAKLTIKNTKDDDTED